MKPDKLHPYLNEFNLLLTQILKRKIRDEDILKHIYFNSVRCPTYKHKAW